MTIAGANGRALALAILFGAIALVWLFVIQPVTDAFAAQQDEIVQSRALLGALEARIAAGPLVAAHLAKMKAREASTAGLIPGKNAEIAAAGMQNLIKALIEGESGQIRSAQNLPPVDTDGFERINIQYDLSLPMARLRDVSYRLETSLPFLFLDGVDIQAPEGLAHRRQPKRATESEYPLDGARLSLEGRAMKRLPAGNAARFGARARHGDRL